MLLTISGVFLRACSLFSVCLFGIGYDRPGTCCVDQTGIKFTVNLLGLPSAGIKKHVLPCLATPEL